MRCDETRVGAGAETYGISRRCLTSANKRPLASWLRWLEHHLMHQKGGFDSWSVHVRRLQV